MPQSQDPHVNVALVGSWRVGMIAGKVISDKVSPELVVPVLCHSHAPLWTDSEVPVAQDPVFVVPVFCHPEVSGAQVPELIVPVLLVPELVTPVSIVTPVLVIPASDIVAPVSVIPVFVVPLPGHSHTPLWIGSEISVAQDPACVIPVFVVPVLFCTGDGAILQSSSIVVR